MVNRDRRVFIDALLVSRIRNFSLWLSLKMIHEKTSRVPDMGPVLFCPSLISKSPLESCHHQLLTVK